MADFAFDGSRPAMGAPVVLFLLPLRMLRLLVAHIQADGKYIGDFNAPAGLVSSIRHKGW
jgi:hypothetical protein